jgi:hypothetical protein
MMSEPADRASEQLPERVRTLSGDVVYPNETRWSFRSEGATFSFNFDLAPTAAGPIVISWKRTIIRYLQNKSAHHAKAGLTLDLFGLSTSRYAA